MFSFLRYFFGTSVIIILTGSVLFGWSYRVAADDIITRQVQQINLVLAKSFRNNVWKDYAPIMQKYFYDMKPGEREQYKEYVDFGNKTRSILRDIEVVKFTVYTPEGEKLISTNQFKSLKIPEEPEQEITGYNKKLTPLAVLQTGEAKSEIIYQANYISPLGNKREGVLVRTLIPLKSESSPDNVIENPDKRSAGVAIGAENLRPEAVLEIFFDVTKNSGTLRSFQYLGAAFIIFIFTILYLALIYTSSRAEKIIERQHETNIDLAAAKARAETENQQKSQFLANISHELRTPLNAIIGFSEIIKDEIMGPIVNEQYKNYIKDIHSEGVHLLTLINDILDYSKAEAGKLDIEYEDIDLSKLIVGALRSQEPRAQRGEVELVKELPEEHILIRSDAKRLKQIMLNLLSNAVKFTPAGGMVKVSAWLNFKDGGTISIEVKDTGIGIAPKDIAKALSPFGQVDSELSRRYEGTGLGLPLTKKFTELLGGQLKLTSEVNKGTIVMVILPINNDANALAPKI